MEAKEANYVEINKDELLLMTQEEEHDAKQSDVCSQILDVPIICVDILIGFQALTQLSLTQLRNNTKMEVSRNEVVKIYLQGVCYNIGDVYCVPELKTNLLSVG